MAGHHARAAEQLVAEFLDAVQLDRGGEQRLVAERLVVQQLRGRLVAEVRLVHHDDCIELAELDGETLQKWIAKFDIPTISASYEALLTGE